MSLPVLCAVAAAGAVGAVCRFTLATALRAASGAFPYDTLVVNLVGCLVFGVCMGLGAPQWQAPVRAAVVTGFLGAFTTFSAFAGDCAQLLEQGRWLALGGNLALQNGLGILAVVAGAAAAAALRG